MNKEIGMLSPTVACIPFMHTTDAVRIHTGSNLSKQSVNLVDAKVPFCLTGYEDIVLRKSSFVTLAENDGEIIFRNEKIIVVKYIDDSNRIYLIKPEELSYNSTNIKSCDYNVGDTFKKGDILVYGSCVKDGYMALGTNLKTAFGIWKGYNFEDAIVISETASKKLSHYTTKVVELYIDPTEFLDNTYGDDLEFIPIPTVGMKLTTNILAKKLNIDEDKLEVLFTALESTPVYIDYMDYEVADIEIFVNGYYKKNEKWAEWVEREVATQMQKEKEVLSQLDKLITDKDVIKQYSLQKPSFANVGNYTTKDGAFSGMFIYLTLRKAYPAEVGDKLANRHGNKGIISLVLPDDQMPKTKDGNNIEIILNTMGVISRMNIGQFYELHMGEVCKQIGDSLLSDHKNIKKNIIKLLPDLDGTKDGWYSDQVKEQLTKLKNEQIIQSIKKHGFISIQPPFETVTYNQLLSLMTKFNVEDISELTYDETKIGKAACGYMHMMKLHHVSRSKLYGRSIGSYTVKFQQPVGGRNNQGGNRLGEMEIWSFIAHELHVNLKESLTIKSDDVEGRKKLLDSLIKGEDDLIVLKESKSVAVDAFRNYLGSIGIVIEEIDPKKKVQEDTV